VVCRSIAEIDWDALWEQQMAQVSFKGEGAAFWDKRARDYDNDAHGGAYIDELLRRIDISPEQSLLDVGCGTGALAVPVSRRCYHVTGVDWSPAMLAKLAENADRAGAKNITTVCLDWPGARVGTDIHPHDVVIASRSLPMGNLRQSLTLMDKAASRRCYLTWIVGADPKVAAVCSLLGKEYHPFPDYLIIANMLHGMGICANIEIFTVKYRRFYRDLDQAVSDATRGHGLKDEKTKQKIKDFLEKDLLPQEDGYVKDGATSWALIWWQKKE